MVLRPGEPLSRRPLHFIWIVECSSSMGEPATRIETLNIAIRDAILHMQDVARENPNAQILVRAIRFSTGAFWYIADPTPINDFKWNDLTAGGLTDMGKALCMVADQLKVSVIGERALPPVLVLISSGQPTDDFSIGLNRLMDEPWGKKAVRIAVAVGSDADKEVLQRFIGHPEIPPLEAKSAAQLWHYIKWVSTRAFQDSSLSPTPDMSTSSDDGAIADPDKNTSVPVVMVMPELDPVDPDDEVW